MDIASLLLGEGLNKKATEQISQLLPPMAMQSSWNPLKFTTMDRKG